MAEETSKKKKKHKKEKSKISPEQEIVDALEKERVESFIKQVDSPEWKFEKRKHGVDIYRLKNHEIIHKIKGVTTIQATPQELHDLLKEFPKSMSIADSMFIRGEELKEFNSYTHVYYASFKMPPLITNREFIWIAFDKFVDDTKSSGVSFGITLPDWSSIGVETPPETTNVRATILESGYYWKGDERGCTLNYVVQADAKGWLPVWVVNLVAADQALNVYRIRKYVHESKGIVDADSKDEDEEKDDVTHEENHEEQSAEENEVETAGLENAGKKKKKKKKKAAKEQKEPEAQEEEAVE